MNERTWAWKEPLVVAAVAPKDYNDPSAPVAVTAQDFKVYVIDAEKSNHAAVATAIGAGATDTLVLDAVPSDWVAGDVIILDATDDSYCEDNTILTITLPDTVQFTANVADAIGVGARARKQLRDTVSGSAYGTADLTKRDWGYVASIPVGNSGWNEAPRPAPGDHVLVEARIESSGVPAYITTYNVTLVGHDADR